MAKYTGRGVKGPMKIYKEYVTHKTTELHYMIKANRIEVWQLNCFNILKLWKSSTQKVWNKENIFQDIFKVYYHKLVNKFSVVSDFTCTINLVLLIICNN